MTTGFSLLEILHRENPVFITGMGLQCALSILLYQRIFRYSYIVLHKSKSFSKISLRNIFCVAELPVIEKFLVFSVGSLLNY